MLYIQYLNKNLMDDSIEIFNTIKKIFKIRNEIRFNKIDIEGYLNICYWGSNYITLDIYNIIGICQYDKYEDVLYKITEFILKSFISRLDNPYKQENKKKQWINDFIHNSLNKDNSYIEIKNFDIYKSIQLNYEINKTIKKALKSKMNNGKEKLFEIVYRNTKNVD